MKYIELFAGCGGLSLGLESVGFELHCANELSPMAAQTFAYNLLAEDLKNSEAVRNTYWISSQFARSEVHQRLRENPNQAVGFEEGKYTDLNNLTRMQINRSLLVGSITDLNNFLERDKKLKRLLASSSSGARIDLLSGGPPCQSFSLAGLRQVSNERNLLPWEFAKFARSVKPKIVLLENVSGILRPFKVQERKYYAWFEVAKAFAQVGYIPICLHINAKYVGVAQNRPRFVLLGVAADIFSKCKNKSWFKELAEEMDHFHKFYDRVKNGEDLEYGELEYLDIEKQPKLFNKQLLSHLKTVDEANFTTVKDAIDDLRKSKLKESDYVKSLNGKFHNPHGLTCNKHNNHELRLNKNLVKARFRLYQVLNKMQLKESKEIGKYLKTAGESRISREAINSLARCWLLDTSGEKIGNPTEKEILALLGKLHTKKQTQRALVSHKPAPAALSIPDDACHYHETIESQRTLTVREMARIQSFPDWFEIKSKVTTGGSMRKYEVPQYTQIGNAVPPLLGIALGKVVKLWVS